MGIVPKHRATPELSHPATYSANFDLFLGKKVLRHHQSNDQNRCSEKRANRAPQPRPKCQSHKDDQRVQAEISADDVRRYKVPFDRLFGSGILDVVVGSDWRVPRYTDSDHWIGGVEALSSRGRERSWLRKFPDAKVPAFVDVLRRFP